MADFQLKLPTALEPFRDKFLQTKTPFVRAQSKGQNPKTPLWRSKVGGIPYLPKGATWPTMPDGRELFFLAQINFAEMPRLAPFPERGLLQFFISDDDLYGMDFDGGGETQDSFRVLWHPEVVENEAVLQTRFNILRDYELLPHHPDECYPLTFEPDEEVVPVTDYRFFEHFGQDFFQQFGAREWHVMDEYAKANKPEGHKIGGYAYFTQDDPRTATDPMLLLFQLDSDEGMDLMWGDMGVGHFFIREKDLLARDFSRVFYDWDNL